MAHTNIAWTVWQGIETILKTNIKDAHIENVYRFPDDDNTRDYAAKYGRAVLVKLDNDEEQVTGNQNYVERFYHFTIRAIVRYTTTEQKDVMNLSEEVKHWCHQNLTNGATWQGMNVQNIEYIEPDADTHYRQADLTVRIMRDG